MKLEVWSPLPPTRSGIAAHVAEVLPRLRGRIDVAVVVERPTEADGAVLGGVERLSPDQSDPKALCLYEIGNSRHHGFVYREALRRPGVLRLHEWSLHSLVLWETHHKGDDDTYERLMVEAYGATGSVAAREALRGRGTPLLESLYPLSEHVVAGCRAVAGTTAMTCSRAAAVRPGIPTLHLPLHALPPVAQVPSRAEAREALGLPADAFVVTAPGLVNPLKGLDVSLRAAARLRRRGVPLHFVVAGHNEPQLPLASWAREADLGGGFELTGWLSPGDFARHIAAADVVLALRFPTLGEASAVLLRAMAVGRPVIVTAGTPADVEFPEGVVVPVDPGRYEEAELEAQLELLFRRADLAERIGRHARLHAQRHHDPDLLAARLVRFLESIAYGEAR
jgi:glycosyltransferase involved in cell wall biosynthesis